MAMTFLRGPKLLNALLNQGNTTWLLGCFFLLISTFAWSSWLILQVKITVHCSDHLYTTSWTCFMATVASFLMALALGNTDLHSWKLDSSLKLSCCIYSGLQLAVLFFLQAWCVSRKGPLFSALFNPLSTVIVTFFGALYLKEKTYLGRYNIYRSLFLLPSLISQLELFCPFFFSSLLGALAIIINRDGPEAHDQHKPKLQSYKATVMCSGNKTKDSTGAAIKTENRFSVLEDKDG